MNHHHLLETNEEGEAFGINNQRTGGSLERLVKMVVGAMGREPGWVT